MPKFQIFPDGRAAGSAPVSGSDFVTKDYLDSSKDFYLDLEYTPSEEGIDSITIPIPDASASALISASNAGQTIYVRVSVDEGGVPVKMVLPVVQSAYSEEEGYYITLGGYASGNDSHISILDGTIFREVREGDGYICQLGMHQASEKSPWHFSSNGTGAVLGISAGKEDNIGYGAVIAGWLTTASGDHSFVEGSRSLASGIFSHAEGRITTAEGSASHAEGNYSVAVGMFSHAEGSLTRTTGTASHAEGTDSTASAEYSHAEGYGTYAQGRASHAEGNATRASGSYSHAEGWYTLTLANYSHAEGQYTTSSNQAEHAQGRYNATASQQIFSIGVGDSAARRKNAISVITGSGTVPSASIYLYGIGGYNGTNPTPGTNDIATVISNISASAAAGGGGITAETDPIYLADSASLKASGSLAKTAVQSSQTASMKVASASVATTADSAKRVYASGTIVNTKSYQMVLIEEEIGTDSFDLTMGPSYNPVSKSLSVTASYARTASYNAQAANITAKTASYEASGTLAKNLTAISASLIASGTLAKNVTAITASLVASASVAKTASSSAAAVSALTASLVASASVAKTASSSAAAISAKTGSYDALVGLPAVTAADNGKILRVVNGAWALVDPVTVYSGQGAPDSALGQDGDIYLQS